LLTTGEPDETEACTMFSIQDWQVSRLTDRDSGAESSEKKAYLDPLNHQSAVLRTKPDAVAKRNLYICLAGLVGDVIQITFGIGLIEVYGWRYQSGVHGAERRAQTGGAAGALGMAHL